MIDVNTRALRPSVGGHQSILLFARPCTERLPVALRELCAAVDERVRAERHRAAPGRRADSLQKAEPVAPGVLAPAGEVEVAAAVGDVVDDEPGGWRDVRVPGPVRAVRVAVHARAFE